MFLDVFATLIRDLFLLAASFPALVLLTVWGIRFVAEKKIMTVSIGMKLFPFLLLPEAVVSFQLQKFKKLIF